MHCLGARYADSCEVLRVTRIDLLDGAIEGVRTERGSFTRAT
jgi:hypothetical protein